MSTFLFLLLSAMAALDFTLYTPSSPLGIRSSDNIPVKVSKLACRFAQKGGRNVEVRFFGSKEAVPLLLPGLPPQGWGQGEGGNAEFLQHWLQAANGPPTLHCLVSPDFSRWCGRKNFSSTLLDSSDWYKS